MLLLRRPNKLTQEWWVSKQQHDISEQLFIPLCLGKSVEWLEEIIHHVCRDIALLVHLQRLAAQMKNSDCTYFHFSEWNIPLPENMEMWGFTCSKDGVPLLTLQNPFHYSNSSNLSFCPPFTIPLQHEQSTISCRALRDCLGSQPFSPCQFPPSIEGEDKWHPALPGQAHKGTCLSWIRLLLFSDNHPDCNSVRTQSRTI